MPFPSFRCVVRKPCYLRAIQLQLFSYFTNLKQCFKHISQDLHNCSPRIIKYNDLCNEEEWYINVACHKFKFTILISLKTRLSYRGKACVTFNQLIILQYFRLQGKYWLKCSMRIILSVINRLYQVQKDKNDQQTNLSEDQLKKLNDLLNKLKTNCLPLLNVEMDQSSNDAQKRMNVNQIVQEKKEKTILRTAKRKMVKMKQVMEIYLMTNTKSFFLLYTCTLILKTELDSCTDICKYT